MLNSSDGCKKCHKPVSLEIEPFRVQYDYSFVDEGYDEALFPAMEFAMVYQEYFFHSHEHVNAWFCSECLEAVRGKGTPFEYIHGYRHFSLKVDRTGLVYNKIIHGLMNNYLIKEKSGPFFDWIQNTWFSSNNLDLSHLPPPWKAIEVTFTDEMREKALYTKILKQFILVAIEFDLHLIRIGRREDERLLMLTAEEELPVLSHVARELQARPDIEIDLESLVPMVCHALLPVKEEELEVQRKIFDYINLTPMLTMPVLSIREQIAEELDIPVPVVQYHIDLLIKQFLITYKAPSKYGLSRFIVRSHIPHQKKFRINEQRRLKNRILFHKRD